VFLEGALVRPWVARVLAVVWLVAVVCVSIAAGARPDWVRALAASPARVGEGKLWFLVSSAVLVDRPVVLSLLSFAVLATLALTACGSRTFWWSAILGQVVATLLVYVFIGAARRIVAARSTQALARLTTASRRSPLRGWDRSQRWRGVVADEVASGSSRSP